eukprot:SAG22_NODE_1584_length_4060_cov_81.610452_4_plen_58_part_00
MCWLLPCAPLAIASSRLSSSTSVSPGAAPLQCSAGRSVSQVVNWFQFGFQFPGPDKS